MDLKLMVLNGYFQIQANYFVIAQLDELTFPSKERKTQKQRTEILTNCTNARFKKNLFNFKDLSFGSRITIKLGVFMTKHLQDPENNQDLLNRSRMVGSAAFTITQKLLTLLRQEKKIEQDLQIIQTDGQKEIGRLAVCLKYYPTEFSAQIQDDIRVIENIFFDVFEQDPTVATQKSREVEEQLFQKQKEMLNIQKKLDFIRNAHKSVSYDLGKLRDLKDTLEKESIDYKRDVVKYNDVDEIHIHIDLLKQTDQGVEVLREKYAHLTNKLTFERSVYNDFSEHYFHIETQIQRAKDLQKQINEIKEAGTQQEFHLKRANDLLPQIESLKNTIVTQESIIKNLQNTIQTHLKNQDRVTSKDLRVRVEQLKHEKDILLQRENQMKVVFQIGKGDLNYNEYQKFKNDSMLQEDPQEILFYQKKNERLMKEIEQLTNELENINAAEDLRQSKLQQKDFDVHMTNFDRNQLILEIEQRENQSRSLQAELVTASKNFAIDLSELKIKRNLLNSLIEANSNVKEMMF